MIITSGYLKSIKKNNNWLKENYFFTSVSLQQSVQHIKAGSVVNIGFFNYGIFLDPIGKDKIFYQTSEITNVFIDNNCAIIEFKDGSHWVLNAQEKKRNKIVSSIQNHSNISSATGVIAENISDTSPVELNNNRIPTTNIGTNQSTYTSTGTTSQSYDLKWYQHTWLICILFAFWFLYGIPVIIGIILLVAKNKADATMREALRQLSRDNDNYARMLSPEMQDAVGLQHHIDRLHDEEKAANNRLQQIDLEINKCNQRIDELNQTIKHKKKDLVVLDEEILVQEFGLYKPQYDFATALDYKEELQKIRAKQKELIKNKLAVSGNMNWQVNGSASKGKKMVSDTQKLLLKAFNTECDAIISKVKYTNFDASLERIYKSSSAISKLGTMMNIAVTQRYIDAKVKELRLAFEYQLKKQEEKEEQKAARAEQREQARIQKEIEEQRKKIEKEQNHYRTAYEKIRQQLQNSPDDPELLRKQTEFEDKLDDIDHALSDIDYRQANMRAGYVYVISNIGAFGEDVYKIGMTRRLDPQDRVDELGDASVPFKFDVHAMIFSDDAPALETALHKAFEDKKINMVNHRREFFRVTLDEIKRVVKENYDKTVEFVDVPDAEQYRISEKMRNGEIAK